MSRMNLTIGTIGLILVAGSFALSAAEPKAQPDAGTAKEGAAAGGGISGFGGDGTGWKVNNDTISSAPFPEANVLQLTDNAKTEIRSAFYATAVPVISGSKGFTVSFTYTASGDKAADGAAFVLQQDGQGANAIGGPGGGLGYFGISPSVAFEMNLYNSGSTTDNPAPKRGVNWVNNEWGTYTPLSHVDLASGNPIEVTLSYDPASTTLTAKLTDATAKTEDTFTSKSLDVAKILGSNEAYVGFTGATGGSASTQQIRNFSLKVGDASK